MIVLDWRVLFLLLCWLVILQVMECLKQNEELRGILEKLRVEQANGLPDSFKNGVHETDSSTSIGEVASLKVIILTLLISYNMSVLCCQFMLSPCGVFFGSKIDTTINCGTIIFCVVLWETSLRFICSQNFDSFHLFLFLILHPFDCLAGPTCEGNEQSRDTNGRSHATLCTTWTSQTSIWWSCTLVRPSLFFHCIWRT